MIEFRWPAPAPHASSDEVREAFARRGLNFAAELDGEFAAVICDGRRVVAARSALCGPALYYVAGPRGIALSEDPESLLPLTRGIVHPETIRDFLRGELRDPERTFFCGLRRLPPGHVLCATADSISVARWFVPEASATSPEGLRAELERAVRLRLDAERPTLVHLSGGIDSSAVAALAAREGRPIVVASGRYPGLDCDEGRFIAAARSRIAAPFREWNGTRTVPLAAPPLAHPWMDLQAGDAAAEAELARQAGARWILTGHGGDELFFERGVFRDLARHGRLARLLRETWLAPRYSTQPARFWLRDSLRGLRRPAAASHTQDATWRWLTSSHAGWMRDLQDHALARAGLAYRRPLLDGRLARFVLALPFGDRLPGGRMKALLRDAIADLLPADIHERDQVTTFESALLHHARAARPGIAELLRDRWRSEPYLPRARALELLAGLDAGDAGAAQAVFAAASLERWLRAIASPGSLPS